VVCNNIEDVRRFAELLKEELYWDNYDVENFVDEPSVDGYRAFHINLRVDVGEPLSPDIVLCEVQIRTRLQDAWAELSHEDIYKPVHLSDGLRARTKDLAEILAAADKVASGIRLDAKKEVAPPEDCPDMSQVSVEGLAYCFKYVFGRPPSDYAVRMAHNLCSRLQIAALNDFLGILDLEEFRDKVEQAYRSVIKAGIENEMIFLAALYATAKDEAAAVRWVRERARRERREIEQVAMHQALSDLPATYEDFITRLEDPHKEDLDIEEWAKILRATTECIICGADIVQPSAFAEAVMEHYGLSEEDEADACGRIESAIHESGVDIGNWEGAGALCAFHGDYGRE